MPEEDKNKEREHAINKYRNLSEEDKIKRRKYEKNRYYNMSEKKSKN